MTTLDFQPTQSTDTCTESWLRADSAVKEPLKGLKNLLKGKLF